METLIALFLVSKTISVTSTPLYRIGNCYEIQEPEWRPGLIRITDLKKEDYEYQVYNNPNWSQKFLNQFDTIETVYGRETKCPQ